MFDFHSGKIQLSPLNSHATNFTNVDLEVAMKTILTLRMNCVCGIKSELCRDYRQLVFVRAITTVHRDPGQLWQFHSVNKCSKCDVLQYTDIYSGT